MFLFLCFRMQGKTEKLITTGYRCRVPIDKDAAKKLVKLVKCTKKVMIFLQ